MTKTTPQQSTNVLLLKNLPKDVENLTEMLARLRPLPSEIKPFGRRRALLYYKDEEEAKSGLQQLQGIRVQDGKIFANLFYKNSTSAEGSSTTMAAPQASNTQASPRRRNKVTRSTQTSLPDNAATAPMPAISSYVRKLYACNSSFDFEQPPPPYLRYSYPRITPAILDSICIALMSNTRFYTQVLHLMNRMNLEPPFERRKQKFIPPGEPCDTGTQTEQQVVVLSSSDEVSKIRTPPLSSKKAAVRTTLPSSEEESELETSADELEIEKRKNAQALAQKKRKPPPQEPQYKKKARLLLHSTLQQKMAPTQTAAKTNAPMPTAAISTQALHEVFEAAKTVKSAKIALNLFKAAKQSAAAAAKQEPIFTPPADLASKRLCLEELQKLSVFKNYVKGELSPKLYIKNLSKDVCAEDLIALYARFALPSQLDVKVMQQGRMKGQAFVTFKELIETELEPVVGRALAETNGFLLKNKPMIVCFGRK